MELSKVLDGDIVAVKTYHGWVAAKFEKRRYSKKLDKYYFNGKWYQSKNVRYATSAEIESYIKRLESDLRVAKEAYEAIKDHEEYLERINQQCNTPKKN